MIIFVLVLVIGFLCISGIVLGSGISKAYNHRITPEDLGERYDRIFLKSYEHRRIRP